MWRFLLVFFHVLRLRYKTLQEKLAINFIRGSEAMKIDIYVTGNIIGQDDYEEAQLTAQLSGSNIPEQWRKVQTVDVEVGVKPSILLDIAKEIQREAMTVDQKKDARIAELEAQLAEQS